MGLIVILVIYLPKWARGEVLNSANAFSLLAMIFYLFFGITSLALYAMSTVT